MSELSKDYIESGLANREFSPSKASQLISKVKVYIAEFMGTLVLVLFGCGSIAQVTVNKAAVGSSFLSINLGWGLGLTMGILLAAPISGGHLNPAVTFANALFGNFPWRKAPGYMAAQTFGAFIAAALVHLIYWPAFNELDGGVRRVSGSKGTAGVFATYPHPKEPTYNAFFTEIILTSILIIGVLAITNPRHKVPTWGVAITAGALLTSIGMSLGLMTGYAMNPARDFGPRLYTAMAGWGADTFSARDHYFWVPIFAPFMGAPLGMAIYNHFIEPEDPYQ